MFADEFISNECFEILHFMCLENELELVLERVVGLVPLPAHQDTLGIIDAALGEVGVAVRVELGRALHETGVGELGGRFAGNGQVGTSDDSVGCAHSSIYR